MHSGSLYSIVVVDVAAGVVAIATAAATAVDITARGMLLLRLLLLKVFILGVKRIPFMQKWQVLYQPCHSCTHCAIRLVFIFLLCSGGPFSKLYV